MDKEALMNPFRNPFADDQSIKNLEMGLLRAYFLFDIFQRLVVLSIDQIHEVSKHLGLWS